MFLLLAAIGVFLRFIPSASAEPPKPVWSGTLLSQKSAAVRSANLSPGQCQGELTRQKLPVKRAFGAAKGIATPVRVAGPFGSVAFVTPGRRSVYGMFDCRLSLSLMELARVLERYDVVEVRVDNLYRPRAHLPGRRSKRSQHAYGLAIDITGFKLASGEELVIEKDWQGSIGEAPCGDEPTSATLSSSARTLRAIVCDVARAEIFHHLLTPNYDAAHANHFHFDIQRGEKSTLLK